MENTNVLEEAVLAYAAGAGRMAAGAEGDEPNTPESGIPSDGSGERTEEPSTSYNLNLNLGGNQQPTPGTSALTEEEKQKRMIIAGAITFLMLIVLIIAVSIYKRKKV
jgi:hypothetical protein